MHAKKAAGEITRFPGGRKSGSGWITPRMWEMREIETMQRIRAEREARQPPSTPPRRRGRPSNAELVKRAKAELTEALAQVQVRQDEARLPELLAALNAGRK
jgi:hypothetical protein